MAPTLGARALAEALGTFILVSAVTDATIGGSQIGALCVACALMVAVYGVGGISGGHLNPAVSFGVLITKRDTKFKAKEFVVYTLAQLVGAVVGAFKNVMIFNTGLGGATSTTKGTELALIGNMTHPMQNKLLGSNYTNVGAVEGGLVSIGLAEMIYTAVLVFVVLNVATCGDEGKGMKNSYFGLAIGFVIAAAASAIGSISMCALNPAVAFAIAVLDASFFGNLKQDIHGYTKGWPFLMFAYYTLMELIGAAIAAGLFFLCRHRSLQIKSAKLKIVKDPGMCSKFTSEFLGTFVLCITVMLVVHAPASPIGCVGIASSLMVMIYALGAVSGANFNPAVSLGLVIIKALPLLDFAVYVAAQLLGALFALFTSYAILRRIDVALVAKDVPIGSPKFGAAAGTWGAVLIAEAIFTFVLVFTVLNVAVRDAPNQYYGLAIGFVIIVGAASVGATSGGCFNPAVALMLDFGGLLDHPYSQFGWGFLYTLVELVAGALAAAFYMCISGSKGSKSEEDMFESLEEAEGDSSSESD